jgi:hypothetical protein
VAAMSLGGVAVVFDFLAAVSREAKHAALVAQVEHLLAMSKSKGIHEDRLLYPPKDPRTKDSREPEWLRRTRHPTGVITRDLYSEQALDLIGNVNASLAWSGNTPRVDAMREYDISTDYRKKISAARRARDAELKREMLDAWENREQLPDYLAQIHDYEAGEDATERFRVDEQLAADAAKAHATRAKAWGQPSAVLFACAALAWLVRVSVAPAYRVVLRPIIVWSVRQGRSAADAARREASSIDAESRRD